MSAPAGRRPGREDDGWTTRSSAASIPAACGSDRCNRPTNRNTGAWTRDGWRCRHCYDRMPRHRRRAGGGRHG